MKSFEHDQLMYEEGRLVSLLRNMFGNALKTNPNLYFAVLTGCLRISKALPSMQGFFSICEYLQITPGDFFNEDSEAPREVRELLEKIEMLTPEQRTLIRQVVEQFLGE